jgi:hypothetical protein
LQHPAPGRRADARRQEQPNVAQPELAQRPAQQQQPTMAPRAGVQQRAEEEAGVEQQVHPAPPDRVQAPHPPLLLPVLSRVRPCAVRHANVTGCASCAPAGAPSRRCAAPRARVPALLRRRRTRHSQHASHGAPAAAHAPARAQAGRVRCDGHGAAPKCALSAPRSARACVAALLRGRRTRHAQHASHGAPAAAHAPARAQAGRVRRGGRGAAPKCALSAPR